ncbi:AraC family transcriptional regulator [Bradyrhizobium sp. HKCCYLS2038]|uniref:AraC family transcriptional regulator n=1 Tax=unclassified Bradyrhizobium TaxID=2631580 RepID=UPI003EBD5E7D
MTKVAGDISWLGYSPPGRKLDMEVFPFSDILRRTNPAVVRAPHRYEFHLLLLVTEGVPTQVVDFEPVQCAPGSILILRPGQVHSFGPDLDWEGWLVLFLPEFVPTVSDVPADLTPGRMLERMPEHIRLDPKAFRATNDAIVTMADEARSDVQAEIVHTLLRYQLCTLILRLHLLNGERGMAGAQRSSSMMRFVKFRELLEANYSSWHQVAPYAKALGCTEKSVNRASREATALGAKDYIARRVILEAKRLLAHTDKPIYLIAESLGFDEATNFSKFFRKYVAHSPVEFRALYR